MRARNPLRSVTMHQCIDPIRILTSSRSTGARIESLVKYFCAVLLLALLGLSVSSASDANSLEKLANDFWTWRAKYAPFTGDDVNRIERPGGTRDWSRASINKQQQDLAEFEARWKKLDPTQSPVPQQVDYRLTGSALERVRWALAINPRWKHDPNFYI